MVTIDGFEDVPECDEVALMKAVAHQPVSVAMDANGHDIQFYSKVTQTLTRAQSFKVPKMVIYIDRVFLSEYVQLMLIMV